MPEDSRISSLGGTSPVLASWDHGTKLASTAISLSLSAAIIAIRDGEPLLLTVDTADGLLALPNGPFRPVKQGTLETSLHRWVEETTGLELGYTEQLSTFAESANGVSVGYLGLTETAEVLAAKGFEWRSLYEFFPWEDWRKGRPEIISRRLAPRLAAWAQQDKQVQDGLLRELSRSDRIRVALGTDGTSWDEERTLERYKLLCEAGALDDQAPTSGQGRGGDVTALAHAMRTEHACIVAMAIDRLRGRIKHRPVVFDLMQPTFTLFELQKTVEAVLGSALHKQNFRRLVESVGLVEATGEVRSHTGGRPAKLFRFRREALLEHPAPGLRVHAPR